MMAICADQSIRVASLIWLTPLFSGIFEIGRKPEPSG
jgi:hypothetical protein